MTQIRMELEQARADGTLPITSEPSAAPDTHMTILQTILNLASAEPATRQGPAGQQRQREVEHAVRLRVVHCADRRVAMGGSPDESARRLGVNARTLRSWRALPRPLSADILRAAIPIAPPDANLDAIPDPTPATQPLPPDANLTANPAGTPALPPAPSDANVGAKPDTLPALQPLPALGRPLAEASPQERQLVQSWIQEVGPGVGVPTLRNRFPDLARAELDTLVKEARRAWRLANLRTLHVLQWRRPGAVWAADFAQAPCLIDNRYPYVLAVRDLASGLQLCWQPVVAPTAEAFLAELSLLFARFGAPWMLKTDNGSAFIAEVVRWYLHRCQVYQLYSPPHCPEYNGAIEASIGAAKQRTERYSELAGRPGQWCSSDHDSALREANTLTCPRRLHGLTPQQTWDARAPLTTEERACFDATVAQCQLEARVAQGRMIDEPLTRTEQAAVDRVAFSRALVAHDLLLFRRRSIPAPITRPKLAIGG